MRTSQICRNVLLALTLGGMLAGCGGPSDPGGSAGGEEDLTLLTIGTADRGGTMYQVGSAIAQAITQEDSSIKINISASSGSGMNVHSLESGEIDLALVSGDVAYAAVNGQDEFASPVELRAIGAVYSSVSNWMAPASSGYVYVHDLAGAQGVQNLLHGVLFSGQGGVEQPRPRRHGQGEDHTVGPSDPLQLRSMVQAGQGGLLQGPGVDGVAVLGQQAGQLGLPQVAPRHPEIQFVLHWARHLRGPPGRPSVPSYAERAGGCGGEWNARRRSRRTFQIPDF